MDALNTETRATAKPFAAGRVLEKEKLLKEVRRNKELRAGLEAFLFKKDAFLRS